MTWDDHVTQFCKHLSRVLFLLKKLVIEDYFEYLMIACQELSNANVRLGIFFWEHAAASERAFLLLKRAIRLILGAQPRDYCHTLFTR